MAITEQITVPMSSLKNIALINGRNAAPDIKVTKEEYRSVNGQQVLMLQLTGTIQGIKFVYFGYYFSGENGTVQLLSYTSQSLFNKYEADMEKFLNGLVMIKK